MEDIEFEIKLSGNWWNEPPAAEIYIDDQLVVPEFSVTAVHGQSSKTVSFKVSLEEAPHVLRIRYTNKKNQDTVQENGKIVKDQLLHVDAIKIDEVELGNLIYKKLVLKPERDDLDWLQKEIVGQTCSGFVGEWHLEFSLPTYLWLLENL